MEILASQIAKELKNAKQCGVYEPELSRVWPAMFALIEQSI